jgi:hypothetical protein
MNKEIVNGVSLDSSLVAPSGAAPAGRGKLVHDRLGIDALEAKPSFEESLVVDDRCDQSPAQLVESKMTRMLGRTMLPISILQTRGLLGNR